MAATIFKSPKAYNYSKIYNLINTRIDATVNMYTFIDNIETLEILYTNINPPKELKLKNIYDYKFNVQNINTKKTYKNFNQNLLPLTMDTSYFGLAVSVFERLKYLNLINSNFIVNKEKVFYINDSLKLFIFQRPTKKNKLIIVSKKIDTITYLRYIYDLKLILFTIL